jgi:hypothetical protein
VLGKSGARPRTLGQGSTALVVHAQRRPARRTPSSAILVTDGAQLPGHGLEHDWRSSKRRAEARRGATGPEMLASVAPASRDQDQHDLEGVRDLGVAGSRAITVAAAETCSRHLAIAAASAGVANPVDHRASAVHIHRSAQPGVCVRVAASSAAGVDRGLRRVAGRPGHDTRVRLQNRHVAACARPVIPRSGARDFTS